MTKPKPKPLPAPSEIGAFPDVTPGAFFELGQLSDATGANSAPGATDPVQAAQGVEKPLAVALAGTIFNHDSAPVGYMLQPKLAGDHYLTERDARVIQRIKAVAKEARELSEDLARFGADADDMADAVRHLIVGFSLLTRSVAKPTEW